MIGQALTEGAERTASARMARALTSLEGLSCGDAFGECFFAPRYRSRAARAGRTLPDAPWFFTDDTLMAASVCACLERHSAIEPEWLATSFARLFDPGRGYGAAMQLLLTRLGELGATAWRDEAQALFGGQGSFGNGAAMRVAPVGAYFADDLERVAEQAALSAVTTHCHPEAIAGAVAIALGAAVAWRTRDTPMMPAAFLGEVRARTPESQVRQGIDLALELPNSLSSIEAAAQLGNGARVSAQDTVPFALWMCAHGSGSYEDVLWSTVGAGGDLDTNCAIVGGIMAMRVGAEGIPSSWLERREALDALLAQAME